MTHATADPPQGSGFGNGQFVLARVRVRVSKGSFPWIELAGEGVSVCQATEAALSFGEQGYDDFCGVERKSNMKLKSAK
jgi:hypothetical protein